MKKILIISALKKELEPFLNSFSTTEKILENKLKVYISEKEGCTFYFCNIGIGKAFRKNISKVFNIDAEISILVGMAGATSKNAKIGEIVFPENIIDSKSDKKTTEHPSENILYRLKTYPAGNILCVKNPVIEKKNIAHFIPVNYIDMESYHFAKFFRENNIPFIVVKAVSDNGKTKVPNSKFIKKSIWEAIRKNFFHFLFVPEDMFSVIKFHKNINISIQKSFEYSMQILKELLILK